MARLRLTRIYTRTGDDGTTGLGGGQRVQKDSDRIAAYGTVDELNSCLGVALAGGLCAENAAIGKQVQNDLFDVGGDLCVLEADKARFKMRGLEAKQVKRLERWIDRLQESLRPLENFILPGGSPGAAQLHVARCVCRRAERDVLRLRRTEAVSKQVPVYLNRLSDLLFVMARYENLRTQFTDVLWRQKKRKT